MNLELLWLEITGRCQLACTHCYADSGPSRTHGTMTTDDWYEVIHQAAALNVRYVQFIGGEPTLHPDFQRLLRRALDTGLRVEVYSNLVTVPAALWDLFADPRVSLATSYYTGDPDKHEAVTGRRSSLARTRTNIAEAVRRSIPLRVGIIDIFDGQRTAEAETELRALGVTDISADRLRRIGRGASTPAVPSVSELCGHCGRGRAVVAPDGSVRPCVMSRWMTVGNVRESALADILASAPMRDMVAAIPAPLAAKCHPECKPSTGDGSDCAPAEQETCAPSFCNPDLRPQPCKPNKK